MDVCYFLSYNEDMLLTCTSKRSAWNLMHKNPNQSATAAICASVCFWCFYVLFVLCVLLVLLLGVLLVKSGNLLHNFSRNSIFGEKM